METRMFYINWILSIIIFVVIGIILRKTYTRKDFLKSATLLVIYLIVLLIWEQITQKFGIYDTTFSLYLYLPIEIFTTITLSLGRVSTVASINEIYLVRLLLVPYLFVLFGKKDKS